MSTLKVNKIRDNSGSTDAIVLDPSGGAVLAGVTTVSTVKVGSGVTLSSDGDIFATGITTVSGDVNVSGDVKVGSGITLSPDGDVFTTGVSTFSGDINAVSVLSAGTVVVSNKPAVAAYLSSTVDHSGTPSTVPFDAETFDHGGCFNATSSAATLNGISVPAHAFLPNVAGIYHVSVTAASGSSTSGSITDFHVALRKNSTDIGHFDADPKDTSPENLASGSVTMLVEMNGTSDFLIVKVGATTSGTAKHLGGGHNCTFSAHKLII